MYGVVGKCAMSVLGRNLSESFIERLLSAGQLVHSEKASRMYRELTQIRTLLRINKKVIKRSKTEVFDGAKKKQEKMIKEEEDRKKVT